MMMDESELKIWALQFASRCFGGDVIYLKGDLGAGKTTLCRYMIQFFGVTDLIKSPTYTLVESYDSPLFMIHHFDLYRLQSPEELDFIGIHDYFHAKALVLIEWPEKGEGVLPPATTEIRLSVVDDLHRLIQVLER